MKGLGHLISLRFGPLQTQVERELVDEDLQDRKRGDSSDHKEIS